MRKVKIIIVLFFFALHTGSAQDARWSQPAGALLYQNPALTGITSKFSAALSYRNQWTALNTPYNTYQCAADYRFGKKEPKKAAFALGFLFLQDFAGNGNFRTTSAGITMSTHLKMSRSLKFCTGMGFNLVQRRIMRGDFSWGTQYDGTAYDPSRYSYESMSFLTAVYGDMHAGMALVYDKNDGSFTSLGRNKLIIGYTINHYNRPNQSMTGGFEVLNMKHTLYLQGAFRVNEHISLKPLALLYYQPAMKEMTAGCLIRYNLGQQSKITGVRKASAFSFGALYRHKDAVIPTLELEKSAYIFGLSYDVNITKLTAGRRMRGGLELSVRVKNTESYTYKNRR